MPEKKPKDWLLAERAYNAFWNQQPQMFFDQLSHDYQMRWVKVARDVALLHDQYKRGPNKRPRGTVMTTEEQRAEWREQAKRRRERARKKSD